jgi:ribosomal protein L40E
MPSSLPPWDELWQPFPHTEIYPGTIYITEENVLCRSIQVSLTKTKKGLLGTSTTNLGSAIYGIDYRLTANTKVALGPLGWKHSKETPAAIVEPLLDESGEPHTLQILTVHSGSSLKIPPPFGLARGHLIDDEEFSRLKDVIEAQARRLTRSPASPIEHETDVPTGSSRSIMDKNSANASPKRDSSFDQIFGEFRSICPKCLRPNFVLDTKCRNCNAPLPIPKGYTMKRIDSEGTKVRCSVCGYFFDERMERCPRCKTVPVASSPPHHPRAEATAGKFCMNCAAPLPQHAAFCSRCGSRQ